MFNERNALKQKMNADELAFYSEYCKSISALTFPKVKADVIALMRNPRTSTPAVLLFAEWMFHKIKIIYSAPRADKKDLFPSIVHAIDDCKTVTIKMKYLNWNDVDYCQQFLYYYYIHRFDDSLFIEQMLNDSNLLKWSQNYLEPEQLRVHFIEWIRSVKTYEQRSNLLDVLLRFFPADSDVKDIFKELMVGSTLYENEQNVHDEDVNIAVLGAVKELYFWFKTTPRSPDNLQVYHANSGCTRSQWVENILRSIAKSSKATTIIQGILTRIAIDKTTFKITDENETPILVDTFEVLFMLLNFIFHEENRGEVCNTMGKALLEEMYAAVDLCITGYVARFINAIQGLTDKFQIELPFRKQLQAKISYDLSKALHALPEDSNVVLGTYEPEYKSEYFDFVIRTVSILQLYEQYGEFDVRKYLPNVLSIITGEDVWKIDDNGKLYAEILNDKETSINGKP